MREQMRAYFDRLLERYEHAGLGLPRAPWDPDVDPAFWVSGPDASEYATWRPVDKTVEHDLDAIAPELAPVPPTLAAYFNTFYFAAMEGQYGGFGLTLEPVLPGVELDSFLLKARGYAGRFSGPPPRLPIGVEMNGRQVVVDTSTGAVGIEDHERGTVATLAPSLEHLVLHLEP